MEGWHILLLTLVAIPFIIHIGMKVGIEVGWRSVSKQLGLTYRFGMLVGTYRGYRVRIESKIWKGWRMRLLLEARAHLPHDLEVRERSQIWDPFAVDGLGKVPTGDRMFDEQIAVSGPEAFVHARLDAKTRKRLVEIISSRPRFRRTLSNDRNNCRWAVSQGIVGCVVDHIGTRVSELRPFLDRLVNIANALHLDQPLEDTLLANAEELAELPSVRKRAVEALLSHGEPSFVNSAKPSINRVLEQIDRAEGGQLSVVNSKELGTLALADAGELSLKNDQD